ncbi:MAG: glycoside hydrolase family 95-like protein, partial [Chthonomonadales bacterium]
EVRGLRARGGFEVEIAWREGRPYHATIRALHRGTCTVRSPKGARVLAVACNGSAVPFARDADVHVVRFPTQPGKTYVLELGADDAAPAPGAHFPQ